DLTTLNNTGGSDVYLFLLTTVSGKSLRITGLSFVTTGSSNGMIDIAGRSTAVRIDHCHITYTDTAMRIGGSVLGVADHNVFQVDLNTPYTSVVRMYNGVGWNGSTELNDARGDHSWNDTEHWGSNLFFFVEDNRFQGNGGVGDMSDAGRG